MIDTTIKISVIVLFALVATALLRNRSAALRHWILAAAILCVALALMLGPIAPAWNLQLDTPSAVQRPAALQPTGDSAPC